MIATCTCSNFFQDERYGPGKRVFNQMKKEHWFRCSVCGAEKEIRAKEEK